MKLCGPIYSQYLILNMGGEPGPAELWSNPHQRPAEHTDVIEAPGLTPEDAVNRLFNKPLNWEVQKTNNPQVVHLLSDDDLVVAEHPDGRVVTSGRIFLTVVELPDATCLNCGFDAGSVESD